MGVKAVGKYLRDKIRENGLKVVVVTRSVGVGPNYIRRLETGIIKQPSLETLKALTEAVHGQWSEVKKLLRDNAELLLRDSLSEKESDLIDSIIEETPDDDLDAILDEIRAEIEAEPSIIRGLRDWLAGRRARGGDGRSR